MYDKWHSKMFRQQFLKEISNNFLSREPDVDLVHNINAKLSTGEKCTIRIEPDKIYSNETLTYQVQKIDHWGWAECSKQNGSIELLALTNEDLSNLLHKGEVVLFSQHAQKIEQFWRLISLAVMYEAHECKHCGRVPHLQDFQDFQKIFKLLDFLMQDRKWVKYVKGIAQRGILSKEDDTHATT